MNISNRNLGSLQLIVLAFDKPTCSNDIVDRVNELREHKIIKVIDSLAVHKNLDGSFKKIKLVNLPHESDIEYGDIIGYLIRLSTSKDYVHKRFTFPEVVKVNSPYKYGLDADNIEQTTEEIPIGGTAVFLLVDHLWEMPLLRTLSDCEGTIISQDFLSPENLIGFGSPRLHIIS